MGFSNLPNFFWIGPQKSASTWAYHCFLEHPDIYVPPYDENLYGIGGDALQYFTIHFQNGENWYKQFYEKQKNEPAVGDTTPSYIRSEKAPARIHDFNPDARLIACLRHPIERAYSHFWHEKKKNKINFEFREVLENYDLFENWIVPGFYYQHLQRYLEYFDSDQILILFLEDLVEDDREFVQTVFSFLGVDADFEPSILGERINEAGYRRNTSYRTYQVGVDLIEKLGIKSSLKSLKKIQPLVSARNWLLGKSEYEKGINEDVRSELLEMYEEPIRNLEDLTNRELDHWRE